MTSSIDFLSKTFKRNTLYLLVCRDKKIIFSRVAEPQGCRRDKIPLLLMDLKLKCEPMVEN